jgi:hypothetical protein
MPRPKKVIIKGIKVALPESISDYTLEDGELPEVQGVNIAVETPVGPRGDYEGRTHAVIVTIYRRARNMPTRELFHYATNDDGHLVNISGEIVFESSKMKETYTFKMNAAFISKWTFTQPPDEGMLFETIVLHVGDMDISANGKTVNFKVPEFSRFLFDLDLS